MSYEISLVDMLRNSNAVLFGRLSPIRKYAEPLLSYTHGVFPYYTPHDFLHSTGVEENLNWIVPDNTKKEMNAHEIFFLIIAAWLHDWGMVASDGEDLSKIRKEHHERTERNFQTLYDKVQLSAQEANIIGRICKGHREVDLYKEEFDDINYGQGVKIRRRFLAALLRIADECDITHNRTPEVIYYSINPTGNSEEEFKKHLDVTGVGQLEEKHKIYISAIARDPRGARALREVKEKIQAELNKVKNILAQNGVTLDVVELKLETRGFIDKPISFEINRTKIVDLLVGEHLYNHLDVAIRELVQNSIDSCKLKESLIPGFSGRIVIQRNKDDMLVIEDNALGMDFDEAKEFLSNIGSSFYTSELFRKRLGDGNYSPISRFGIGILSCFLIGTRMTIDTMKEGTEACKFTIQSVNEDWKYEKSSRLQPGTKITLELNQNGKEIKLEESLQRYLLCPETNIEYRDLDGVTKTFHSVWTVDQIYDRYIKGSQGMKEGRCKEILRKSTPDYDLILGKMTQTFIAENLVLFNHGIFVGTFDVEGLNYSFCISVNMKKDLVDLQISREDVKENERWVNFIYTIWSEIFRSLVEELQEIENWEIIYVFSSLLDSRVLVKEDSLTELLNRNPFVKSFAEFAPFIVVSNNQSHLVKSHEVLNMEEINLYKCNPESLLEETSFLANLEGLSTVIVNPYDVKLVTIGKPDHMLDLTQLLFKKEGVRFKQLDIRMLLLDKATEVDMEYKELIPDNVKLVTFSQGIKSLVVINEPPIIKSTQAVYEGIHLIDANYAVLYKELLWEDNTDGFYETITKLLGSDYYERVEIIRLPNVYVDSCDVFIKAVVDKRKSKEFDMQISKDIRTYLKYLSFLPLVVARMESILILLDTINRLEERISAVLDISRPLPLFRRMSPEGKMFLSHVAKFGMDYIIHK